MGFARHSRRTHFSFPPGVPFPVAPARVPPPPPQVTYMEPMIKRSYLMSKPDECWSIPGAQPQRADPQTPHHSV